LTPIKTRNLHLSNPRWQESVPNDLSRITDKLKTIKGDDKVVSGVLDTPGHLRPGGQRGGS